MYNVFTDFHHASLLQSFILLFEKRLGGNVYRPIGMEWAENGFWKVYDHPATQAQYLGIGAATPDNTPRLNEVVDQGPGEKIQEFGAMWTGAYLCHDIDSGQTNKAITFDAFMRGKFDIVIASIPEHIEPFKRLCAIHPSRPKLIYQIGNAWIPEQGLATNVMASAKMPPIAGTNFIEYHQEFDTKVFAPPEHEGKFFSCDCAYHSPGKRIASFVNVFNAQEHFRHDYQLFTEVERAMPSWSFKSYGGQCRDGAVGPSEVLALEMKHSRFIWHTKAGGDGYGHIIHNAAAVGRPLIVKAEYYKGKMAEPLLIDGVTCITIDGLSISDIVNKINYYNDPARYGILCRAAYDNFTRVVDFDKEFKDLQNFLTNLV
jgi:hypothetical protein